VPVHADAVAGAVRQAGQLVIRAIAQRFVIAPHRVVDMPAGAPSFAASIAVCWPWRLAPHLALLALGVPNTKVRDTSD
jgi:hypothetical protein